MMKMNRPVTERENNYSAELHIVSTTDKKGVTTSANKAFRDISGFEDAELIGKSHNVVRHPDMPPAAFADLWGDIKQGKSWMGVVKNRCKNGDYYWVDAYVTPMLEDGEVTGYQSVRTKPDQQAVAAAEALYRGLNEGVSLWARLKGRLRVGLMGKILYGYVVVLLPAVAILAFAPVSQETAMVLATINVVVGGLLVAMRIARPWQQAAAASRELFENAVAQQVYTQRSDELGQLQLVIKAQQARLGTVVWRIDSAVEELDEIALGTATAVTQTNQAISRQQTEIGKVATAMNEMTATVHEVAQTTTDAAEAAHAADGEARNGTLAATESIRGIDNLVDDVEQAAEVIKKLKQETENIGSVLGVIRGIADQTNLLALNAAIEAARAGEAGRGFAVVADEVRTLASRTQESTREIDSMIERLQAESSDAVEAMKKAQLGAKLNSEQVESLAESLASTAGTTQNINDMNTQIATAAEQQNVVAEEINRNISLISVAGEQTSSASRETAAATENLIDVAGQLRTMIRQFRSA